jgi:hypothetical protein
MKISISFTTEEKNTIVNMMLNTGSIKEVNTNNEHYSGNFGEMKYDNSKNLIEYDLKPSFIKATVGLMGSLINIIRAFVSTCEMYSSTWLEGTKDLLKEESEKEEVKE